MAQFLRPDSNVTQTSFTNGFAQIDEATASDADFAYGANNTAAVLEVHLSNPAATPDPAGTSTVRYRIARVNAGTLSGSGNNVTITAAVYQGTTLIQSGGAQSTSGTWTQFSFTFTHGSLTDWTNLRLRFTTSASGGTAANRRGGAISWAEVEAPDAAVLRNLVLPGDAGSFALSGLTSILARRFGLIASAGQFTATWQNFDATRFIRLYAAGANGVRDPEALDRWKQFGTVTSADATTAPDGSGTADLVTVNTANSTHYIEQTRLSISSASGIVYSCFLKASPQTENIRLVFLASYLDPESETIFTDTVFSGRIDLGTGTFTSSGGAGTNGVFSSRSIESVGNGWYRVSVIGSVSSLATEIYVRLQFFPVAGSTFTGDGVKGFYAWGAQLDYGSLDAYPKAGHKLSGQATTLTYTAAAQSYSLTGDAGSFALTGQAALFSRLRSMAAGAGSFALSGQPAALQSTRRLLAQAGSAALSGQSAALDYARVLQAAAAAFALNGQPAAFVVFYTLSASAGQVEWTGETAYLKQQRRKRLQKGQVNKVGYPTAVSYRRRQTLIG